MASYDIPPWITSANPAQYAAEGIRIGDEEQQAQASSARANQELQMQQQQLQSYGARADQELQLRQKALEQSATQAAQKYQAQQAYSDFLAQGGDPIQAILKFGPAMGDMSGVSAGVRALSQPRKAPFVPGPVQSFPVIGPDGQPVPNMLSVPSASGNGMEARNLPGSDVAGYVSPAEKMKQQEQQRKTSLTVQVASKKKAQLEKMLGDDGALLALAKKKAKGGTPSHADLEAVESDLQSQVDALDEQISEASGGLGAIAPKTSAAQNAPTATNPDTGEKVQYVDGKWQPIPQ
jgi:hypothetical protein